MLDQSKPFTLDKDRSFLHRSSLDQFICASVNGVLEEAHKETGHGSRDKMIKHLNDG